MDDNYIHKRNLVYKNQFHIIFCPKYRKPILTNGVDTALKEILYEEAEKLKVTIKALEVMPDHVHMFIELDPRILLHKVIKQFKGVSSYKLRKKFPYLKTKMSSLWTSSYFSCSIGHISEETITKYIEEQKQK